MADTVHLHVGLPKTGTTYLQTILWHNRARLAEQGLLLPGRNLRQHMWASAVVRGDEGLRRRNPVAMDAWDDLVGEVAAWPGSAIISHEFFGGASAEQAGAALAALAPAQVRVIVTVRDPLSVVSSYWQEFVKHGFDLPLDEFPRVSDDPADEWSRRTVDLQDVLDRWTGTVAPEQVTVVVVPGRDEGRDALWERFAAVIGVDPTGFTLDRARPNESLGVVEAELLRAIGGRLTGFGSALDRGVWVRGYLSHDVLVPRGGERFVPSPDRVQELREQSAAAYADIRARGFQVVGDLDSILVGELDPALRRPTSVTTEELLEASLSTIADLLTDVRRHRRDANGLRKELAALIEAAAAVPERRLVRLRRRLRWLP